MFIKNIVTATIVFLFGMLGRKATVQKPEPVMTPDHSDINRKHDLDLENFGGSTFVRVESAREMELVISEYMKRHFPFYMIPLCHIRQMEESDQSDVINATSAHHQEATSDDKS